MASAFEKCGGVPHPAVSGMIVAFTEVLSNELSGNEQPHYPYDMFEECHYRDYEGALHNIFLPVLKRVICRKPHRWDFPIMSRVKTLDDNPLIP